MHLLKDQDTGTPTMANSKKKVFLGTFVSSKSPKELDYYHDTLVCVDEEGKIVKVDHEGGDAERIGERLSETLGWKLSEVDVHVAKPGEFFFPGFVGEYHIRPCQEVCTNKPQTPTFMHLSIQMSAFLERRHF